MYFLVEAYLKQVNKLSFFIAVIIVLFLISRVFVIKAKKPVDRLIFDSNSSFLIDPVQVLGDSCENSWEV